MLPHQTHTRRYTTVLLCTLCCCVLLLHYFSATHHVSAQNITTPDEYIPETPQPKSEHELLSWLEQLPHSQPTSMILEYLRVDARELELVGCTTEHIEVAQWINNTLLIDGEISTLAQKNRDACREFHIIFSWTMPFNPPEKISKSLSLPLLSSLLPKTLSLEEVTQRSGKWELQLKGPYDQVIEYLQLIMLENIYIFHLVLEPTSGGVITRVGLV